MITEDYVSFETAKLLKEKGFDWEIDTVYTDWGELHRIFDVEYYSATSCFPTISNLHYNDITRSKYAFLVTAPTLQMAMRWLRKKHNLVISTHVTVDGWRSYVSQFKLDGEGFVMDIIDGIDHGNIPNCNTYEQACETAIKYCLENLI